MSRNAVETVMGAVVLVVAAVFLFFAYTTSQVRAISGYDITADFDRVGGLRDGGDVRISGIKVGSIISQTLDPTDYVAIVKMSIDPAIKIPVDSIATITSSSLLGDQYVSIVPGTEDTYIKAGGTLEHTTPPMNLESLIGQYIYGQQSGGQQGGGQQPKQNGQTPPANQIPPAK
ncbi:MAG TPA: outer membrane lipid asymmetry maintenance protein MlaD [Stellaceae bacterium]|jgi:phospholipid/cholesterol/gamma-HCH transport system substrate-binding protein|nr:outer membrane lipid asymmetry maintenance protein MlaD [Stellaceae bacterium]